MRIIFPQPVKGAVFGLSALVIVYKTADPATPNGRDSAVEQTYELTVPSTATGVSVQNPVRKLLKNI